MTSDQTKPPFAARIAALCYAAWGLFHCKVAWDIAALGANQHGITQGRLYQLAAYMLSIALFVTIVGLWRNWRNDRLGYWLNLSVAGWADAIWVLVVVLPGYVDPVRGLLPPAIFLAGALFSTWAHLTARGLYCRLITVPGDSVWTAPCPLNNHGFSRCSPFTSRMSKTVHFCAAILHDG